MSIIGCMKNASGWALTYRQGSKWSLPQTLHQFPSKSAFQHANWSETDGMINKEGYKVLCEYAQLTSKMPILMQGGMGVDRHVKPWRFFGGRMSGCSGCISEMKDMAEMLGLPPTFRKKLGYKFFSSFDWIRLLCLGAHRFLRVARRRRCWKIFVNATRNFISKDSEWEKREWHVHPTWTERLDESNFFFFLLSRYFVIFYCKERRKRLWMRLNEVSNVHGHFLNLGVVEWFNVLLKRKQI